MNQAITDNVAMREAMRVAGINIPTNQRLVWDWLKEHPGQPCKAIQAGLKINGNSVSAQLGLMVERGMLTAKVERAMPLNRDIFHYSVVGKEFRLMPISAAQKNVKRQRKIAAHVEIPAPVAVAVAAPVEVVAPLTVKQEAEAILSHTSILLARELYNQLYQIFSNH